MVTLGGCAGTWYGDAGARKSTYTETPTEGTLDTALSTANDRTIVVTSGDPTGYRTEGTGMQLSLAYETEFLVQFLRYYSVKYDDLNYSYSIDGSDPVQNDLKLKTHGYEYLLGIKLWMFHPRIVFRYDTADISSIAGEYSDNSLFMGYGVGTYFEVYNNWLVYLGWDRYFRVAVDPLFYSTTTEISLGVLYRFGSLGGSSGSTAGMRFGNPFR